MLTRLDDYFGHQSATHIERVTSPEPGWQERNYFNMHAPDGGDWFLVCGMGMSPNLHELNAYTICSYKGRAQIDFRSNVPLVDRSRLEAGAFSYEIVEPFKTWKINLAENDSGLEVDVVYTARHQPWEFAHIYAESEGRAIHDFQHIHQSGSYIGHVTVDGETIDVTGFVGQRDRTWGLRERLEFWIWMCVQFDDRSLSLYHFEDSHGNVQYTDGGLCFADRVGPRISSVKHDISFEPGTKRLSAATLNLVDAAGEHCEVEVRPLGPTVSYRAPYPDDHQPAKELGINRAANGVGRWEYDTYGADFKKYSGVYDPLCEFRCGDKVGHGIFELILLNYQPYGFS
ncbi:MAG: hypothetical protein QM733_11450 [Ilumatobacteraceae bacterium]